MAILVLNTCSFVTKDKTWQGYSCLPSGCFAGFSESNNAISKRL
jgi:hypothetical protein